MSWLFLAYFLTINLVFAEISVSYGAILNPNVNIFYYYFSMVLQIKGNKTKPLIFEKGSMPREEAVFKSGKATVGDGLPADSGIYGDIIATLDFLSTL